VTNHLWQSTLFAAAAGLIVLALRRNRAQVRYWLWFSASCKFLVPFALLMALGRLAPVRSTGPIAATPLVPFAVEQIAQPFPETPPILPAARRSIDWLPIVWACGFAAVVWVRFRGWLRVRAAVRASTPVDIPASVVVRSSPGLLEPGVVGLWRPTLLLPAGIADRLTPPQLEAVLAHELCHVRRRDNLFAAIHMAVEALFWFHPLVWWIGARLVEERERACDEEVLCLGSAPHDYAEAILSVCKHYIESPLECVSGVTGADLKRRIEAIMINRTALALTFTRKATLAAAATAVLAAPIAIGVLHAPLSRAQSPGDRPKFEVASVKPCKVGDVVRSSGQRKAGGGPPISSPGTLSTGCSTVEELIRNAYVQYTTGVLIRDPSSPPLSGGPDWVRTDRYMIDAKAGGSQSQGTMMGPMLQTLLEDRFQLSIRRESREVPVYALTVAKDGPRLSPFQKGSCTPIEFGTVPRPWPVDGCRDMVGRGTVNAPGASVSTLAKLLYLVVDRPVIDKTGISGLFDFHLEFALDERTPYIDPRSDPSLPPAAPADGAGPSVFAVLQKQYGLRLEPAKGPRDFLVIDHVERPSEN
jgi:uncharacterized protein (TIGR03435 family)